MLQNELPGARETRNQPGTRTAGSKVQPLLSCQLSELRIVSREGARVTCKGLMVRVGKEKAVPGLKFSINRQAEKPSAGYAS